MIKRIMIFFKYSSQRILFSEILKLCLVFQKELLYPHSSQLSIIPTMLPVLHLQFPVCLGFLATTLTLLRVSCEAKAVEGGRWGVG